MPKTRTSSETLSSSTQNHCFPNKANKQIFLAAVDKQLRNFIESSFVKKLEDGRLEMADYHRLLLSIFHQSRNGPLTFAIAGASLPNHQWELQKYLIKHSEEEMSHWEWAVEDLKNCGYTGPDPTTTLPSAATAGYISFNFFSAYRSPLSRLGTAAVLESVGAKFGVKYGRMLVEALGLKKNQAVFLLAHGETDVGHTKEIYDLLDSVSLTEEEWGSLTHSAEVGGTLYRLIYDEAANFEL